MVCVVGTGRMGSSYIVVGVGLRGIGFCGGLDCGKVGLVVRLGWGKVIEM